MRFTRLLFVLCFVGLIGLLPNSYAASVFSNYGQIQNVQNYSSNPFWSPNAPYNQRLPQPVYVQGADLTAAECQSIVQSLVSVQCMARNNCLETSLMDIRPAIMVQLSSLPGHNYISSCAGFIDTIYESYVKQYRNTIPNRPVNFPTTGIKNSNLDTNTVHTYPQQNSDFQTEDPKWQQDIQRRTQALIDLQLQNSAGSEQLSAIDFPETIADFSFSERIENAAQGYEPYKDKTAYAKINFINKTEYCKGEGTKECPEEEKKIIND